MLDPELSSTPIKYPTFVTHAHSDHTAALSGSSLTYLTETTYQIYDVTSKRTARNYQFVELNKSVEVGNFEIEFINAGHLLGAAQFIIREGSETFLYTGDFCPEDLLTVKGAEIPKEDVDLTVIDCTYGDQLIFFDSRAKSRQNLFVWTMGQLSAEKIPVINIGHIGGAQEVIKLFNQLTSNNLPILVSDKIARVCQVYEELGVQLNYYKLSDSENHPLLNGKCVILVPRSFKNFNDLGKKYPILSKNSTRCIVTGQSAKYGFNSFDFTSSLSTHAHYHELIDVAKEINPKHILTHYGYPSEFAKSLVDEHNISAESFMDSHPVELAKLNNIEKTVEFKKKERMYGFTPLDYFMDD